MSTATIQTEAKRMLTVRQELALAQAAYAKQANPAARARLAGLLLLDDRHEEVIALLGDAAGLNLHEELSLAQAYLARETAADDALAREAAERAAGLAQSDTARSHALALVGKCDNRLGQRDHALQLLHEALQLDPHNKDACKRIAAIALEAGRSDAVLDLTRGLLAQGIGHSRVFGAQVLALAKAGEIDAARTVEGFDLLHRRQMLVPPPGWDSLEAFNAALADELLAHPDTRYERYGSASAQTWRIENPARADTPLFNALVNRIAETLVDRIAAFSGTDHPWAGFRPDPARLRIWCVITAGAGHETWHVHQFGWLSGVYYVSVPREIAQGTDNRGCLAFGLPEDLAGDAAAQAFGQRIVRPEAGLFLTFPSHIYHRTYPHEGEGRRICVAFDLQG